MSFFLFATYVHTAIMRSLNHSVTYLIYPMVLRSVNSLPHLSSPLRFSFFHFSYLLFFFLIDKGPPILIRKQIKIVENLVSISWLFCDRHKSHLFLSSIYVSDGSWRYKVLVSLFRSYVFLLLTLVISAKEIDSILITLIRAKLNKMSYVFMIIYTCVFVFLYSYVLCLLSPFFYIFLPL